MDLIEHALDQVQRRAFPVYKRNKEQRDPPFGHGEFVPSAIAILLITSGLDYHLARLKYFRDLARQKPALPHTPYFNWTIGDPLSTKVERLLIKRTENRLREQLIELTIMRDSVAHPKLYFIRQIIKPDYSPTKQKVKLSAGISHRKKAFDRKLQRSERTKSLRLPLVPTWISYVDIVVCILVLTRFLHLLEQKYGNPYAWVGGFSARNDPADFFPGQGNATRRSVSMGEWAQAFFNSLSPIDQQRVQTRLGAEASKYVRKRQSLPKIGKGRITNIFRIIRNPLKLEFLTKAPPWSVRP